MMMIPFHRRSLASFGRCFSHNAGSSRLKAEGPGLREFMIQSADKASQAAYLSDVATQPLSFFLETYGCQMNVSDSEIVRSVLLQAGHVESPILEQADLILTNTCAIRENAEQKVWNRLDFYQSLKEKKAKQSNSLRREMERLRQPTEPGGKNPLLVGVLGCMAERIKGDLLKKDVVNFICGPDAYRDLPRLINLSSGSTSQKSANTQLSLEETYADIAPVRKVSSIEAFVSIMRGCNNMCSYCVVPFTRGRERSRSIESIVSEVKALNKAGVKEILLLGQNVNSYHDKGSAETYTSTQYAPATGFSNMYKSRAGAGARFYHLLDAVSQVDPEMRIRFTSPHPKDFPDECLQLVAERPNICKSLHLPAQSGNTEVLARMRRGYSKESYLDLVKRARAIIPGVSISTDIIAGFCGETEEEHADSLDLMRSVRFDQAFMFAYSLREKTHAARNFADDVPQDVKLQRLQQIIDIFRSEVQKKNEEECLGRVELVLVEGPSKKSTEDSPALTGRTDTNKRCVFEEKELAQLPAFLEAVKGEAMGKRLPRKGDYVAVTITAVRGHGLVARPMALTTNLEFQSLASKLVVRE
jgi:MiaB/RimO family radical SAM methylthiotransferase